MQHALLGIYLRSILLKKSPSVMNPKYTISDPPFLQCTIYLQNISRKNSINECNACLDQHVFL